MTLVHVALGSNLGDRARHLEAARSALSRLPDTRVVASSSVEETLPLGGREQPPYLNQMVLLDTRLGPRELLRAVQAIEDAEGRVRTGHWDSRTLDIDLVRFGDIALTDPELTLPHPGLAERDFWQREIAELTAHAP
jgi:2-amino-4-hydroxy-6-hydroxymethyldihydropteridine diphosphokinase